MYGNYIDEVLFMYNFGPPVTYLWYVHDHLYSPVALIEYPGNVLERYEYDAYGNPTILDTQYARRNTSLYDNPYYFQGKRLDLLDNGGLELMLWPYRNYSTYLGRWFQPEKLGMIPNDGEINQFLPRNQYADGLNYYEAFVSNPVLVLDQFGLKKCRYDSFAVISTLKTPVDVSPSEISSVKDMISFISGLAALAGLCPSSSWAVSAPWGVASAGVPGAYCDTMLGSHMKFCGYDAYILLCDWYCDEDKKEHFVGCAWYKCPKYGGICPRVGKCRRKLRDLWFDEETKVHVFGYGRRERKELREIRDTEWSVETWLSKLSDG